MAEKRVEGWLVENYKEKKKMCKVFIGLENVYDRVSISCSLILQWALLKKRLLKVYVNVIKDIHIGVRVHEKEIVLKNWEFYRVMLL